MKHLSGNFGLRLCLSIVAVAAALLYGATAYAQQSAPGPSSDSVGVEGRIPSPPPTQAATIISPANGQNFTSAPIMVSGSCPAGTLIKVFSNNIFVGSAMCINGVYSLQISLFSGRNDLVAKVYDVLDQPGPDSRTVTVTYTDPQFAQFGSQVLLTSQYARRAANPDDTLDWPVIVSSGVGPYAFSVDWGDGTPAELISQAFAGVINLQHVYKDPGVYKVIFKVADTNGSSAFLQVIAVVNGEGGSGTPADDINKNETVITKTKVLWQLPALTLLMLPLAFWLGRRYELAALRKRLEREYRQQ